MTGPKENHCADEVAKCANFSECLGTGLVHGDMRERSFHSVRKRDAATTSTLFSTELRTSLKQLRQSVRKMFDIGTHICMGFRDRDVCVDLGVNDT